MKIFSPILFVIILLTGCNANTQSPIHTLTNPDFTYYPIFNGKYDVVEFTPIGNTNYFCIMLNGFGDGGIRCYPKQSNQIIKEIK